MSRLKAFVDSAVGWLSAHVSSFGYLLPDSMEMALYIVLAVYIVFQMAQQQM